MDDEELDNTMSLTEMLLQELDSADHNGSPCGEGGSPLFRDASTPPLSKWGAVLMQSEPEGEEEASMMDIIHEFEKTASEMNKIQSAMAPSPSLPWANGGPPPHNRPPLNGPPPYIPNSPMGPNFRGPPMMNGSPMCRNGPMNGPMGPNGPMNNGPMRQMNMGPNGPMSNGPHRGPSNIGPNGPMGPSGPMNSPIGPPNGPMGPNGPMNSPMGPNGPRGPNGPMNSPMGPNGPRDFRPNNGPMGPPPFGNMRPDFNMGPNPFNSRPPFNGGPPNGFGPPPPAGFSPMCPPNFPPRPLGTIQNHSFTATSIPDTTLGDQLKFIKKKKPKPKNASKGVSDPLRSPQYKSNNNDIIFNNNNIREDKLVFRSSNPAVREPSPVKSRRSGKDESFSSHRRKDPITSLRLGENEALPDLYDKLRKLNKEMDNIKCDASSSSSSSECEDNIVEKSLPPSTDRLTLAEKLFPNKSNEKSFPSKTSEKLFPNKTSEKSFPRPTSEESLPEEKSLSVERSKSLEEAAPAPAKPTTDLDTRIKAMLRADEKPVPRREKVAFTLPPKDELQSQNPDSTFVKVPSNPNKAHKPLLRPPSPYLSRDIYYYWHKETLKVGKLRAKHRLLYVDPSVHYRFVDNRVVGVDFGEEERLPRTRKAEAKAPQKAEAKAPQKAEAKAPQKLEAKKTKEVEEKPEDPSLVNNAAKKQKKTEKEGKKAEEEEEDIESALAEDLKRLEDLNRQLALLDEQEQMEQDLNEGVEEDLQDEYAKLAKLQRELALLEQESDTTEGILDTIDVSENMTKSVAKVENILKIKDATDLTPEQDELIKMVMQSFVGDLKNDLKRSLSESLIEDQFNEQHSRMKRAKLA